MAQAAGSTAADLAAGAEARRRGAFEGWPLFGWAALALLAMSAAVLAAYGTDETGVRVFIRATARSSFVLFLPAFVASSLRALWRTPATAWLLRNRRQLGVSFAFSHFLHLLGILSLAHFHAESFHASTKLLTILGGGTAYVFVFALAATSSDAAVRALGPRRWKLLHRVGVWVIFFIFAQSYLLSPFLPQRGLPYVPGALLVLAALALRFAAWRRRARA